MKITKRQLRRIIKESKGWFLLGADGTLAKSQKTRTPIWWSDEAGAKKAYDSGYGGEDAVPVEILLVPDIYAYNGSDADPADLESVRQHLGESKMKITKGQLRRIIREGLLRESFDASLQELQKEVLRLQGYADAEHAKGGENSEMMGGMYNDDANDLQDIHDDVKRAIEQGEPHDFTVSREIAEKMDTSPREKIPQQIYYMIFPELK